MKYRVTVEITLDLEIEQEKQSLAEDTASDSVRAALRQVFPDVRYCSVDIKRKNTRILAS